MTHADFPYPGRTIVIAARCVNLDVASVGTVRADVDRAIEAGARVVLDLEAVEFLDSCGLGAIGKWMAEAGRGRFVMARVGPRLHHSIGRLPPERRPQIFSTIDDACHVPAQSRNSRSNPSCDLSLASNLQFVIHGTAHA